jgi:hypothetical protein
MQPILLLKRLTGSATAVVLLAMAIGLSVPEPGQAESGSNFLSTAAPSLSITQIIDTDTTANQSGKQKFNTERKANRSVDRTVHLWASFIGYVVGSSNPLSAVIATRAADYIQDNYAFSSAYDSKVGFHLSIFKKYLSERGGLTRKTESEVLMN